jgi:hypothetical protein
LRTKQGNRIDAGTVKLRVSAWLDFDAIKRQNGWQLDRSEFVQNLALTE